MGNFVDKNIAWFRIHVLDLPLKPKFSSILSKIVIPSFLDLNLLVEKDEASLMYWRETNFSLIKRR